MFTDQESKWYRVLEQIKFVARGGYKIQGEM
jgi:hypothetical protein